MKETDQHNPSFWNLHPSWEKDNEQATHSKEVWQTLGRSRREGVPGGGRAGQVRPLTKGTVGEA